MLNIYTGHVSALCPQVNDRVLEQLSESRRKRVLSMRNEQGKCQSAAAGLLLKRALGDVDVDIQAHSIVQGSVDDFRPPYSNPECPFSHMFLVRRT